MIKLISKGILSTFGQWKPIMVIYCIQCVIALIVGLQVYQVLEASIGNSLSIQTIAEGFDRTVFTDLFNVHGSSLSPLIGLVRWIILLYLIVSIFLHGGLLGNLVKNEKSTGQFFKNGYLYFVPFLKIGIIFLVFLVIWMLLTGIPYLMIIGPNPFDTFDTEIPFIIWTLLLILLLFIGVGFLWAWSIRSRMRIITNQDSILQSLKKGFKDVFRNIRSFASIVMLLAVIYAFAMFCYTIVMEDRGAESLLVVLSLIVLQQIFAIFRLGLKTIGYSSIIQIDKTT